MIDRKSSEAETPFRVLGEWLTLPFQLEEVASQNSINKGIALVNSEKKRDILKHHVYNDWIVTRIKGSSGNYYTTKVKIWDRESNEIPKTECNCPFGFNNPHRYCYHKVAFVLLILSWNAMSDNNPVVNYEDEYNLDG